MAILKHSDFFDFPRYQQELRDTATAALELAQSTEASAQRMKAAYTSTVQGLEVVQRAVANASTANTQQAAALFRHYDEQLDKLQKDAETYRQLLKRLDDQQNASNFSIAEMTRLLAGLEREYKSLKPDQVDYVNRQQELAGKVRAVSQVLTAQNQVLREAKRATDAAAGSYDELALQTNQLRTALRQMPDAFDRNTGAINRHNHAAVEMQAIIERNDRVLRNADASMGRHQRNVGNYTSTLGGLGSQALFAAGALIGVSSGLEAIQLGLGIISDMERVDAALKAVSKDTADFRQTQQFLIGTADQLGLRYDVLARSYKGLKAATNGTALEGKSTEQMFLGLVRAGAALKLSNEEIEGAIRAVEQMMSKGKITAEELRGQLGERLPGAMRLMAEATGVSEAKLNKMMEQGELLAVDVLPKLAAQLDKTYGKDAQNNLDSMAGGWNRMTNEVHLFLAAMNEDGAISRTTNNITNMIAETLKGLRAAVQSSDWKTFWGALASYTGMGMVIPGIGSDAKEQVGRYARNEAVVNQYRTMNMDQRNARRGITEDAIARDENLLKTTYANSIVGGNKPKIESRITENKQLLEQLNKVEKEVRRKQRKENEQEEINAERAALARKEAEKEKAAKEAQKREAARKKAQTEADKKLNESLSLSKSGTDLQLSELGRDKQDGLLSEQEFIDQRRDITIKGIEARQQLLAAAGKKETDDYKRLAKEKLDAETAYQRDSLKLKLADSKSITANAIADVASNRSEGLITEQEAVEKKYAIQMGGINDQRRLLEEAGQQNSQLMRDLEQQELNATRDYYRDRVKAAEAGWRKELDAVKDAMKSVDAETEQRLGEKLRGLQANYDTQARIVRVAVARREMTEEEGEKLVYALKMQLLSDSTQAVENAYAEQERLDRQLTEERIKALEEWKDEAIRTPAEILAAEAQIAKIRAALEGKLTAEKKKAIKDAAEFAQAKSDETSEHEVKNAETAYEKKQKLWQAGLDLADTIGSALFDVSDSYGRRDLDRLDQQKERELVLAGDNADAKARIEEQYARRKAEISRKMAIQERAAALFSIGINTAQAVMSVLSTGGGAHYLDFGASAGILSAFVTAAGIAQAAAVLAKPLPEFWQGTSYAPEGLAHLAERGPELRQRRDGSFTLYDSPTVDYLDRGDRIYTADQTAALVAGWERDEAARQALQESMLHRAAIGNLRSGRENELRLIHAPGTGLSESGVERAFTSAMRKQPRHVTIVDANGQHEYYEELNSRTEYLNKRHSLD